MSIDCKWVDKNLEALFTADLSAEESRLVRGHTDDCQRCSSEIQALNAIDPAIKRYFQGQLKRASSPNRVPARTPTTSWILQAAAAAAVIMLLVVLLRSPQLNNAPAQVQGPDQPIASSGSSETKTGLVENERAKPSPSRGDSSTASASSVSQAPIPVLPNAPAFLVTDPAGYSRSLEDYRGLIVLIGVWSSNQVESVSNLERLYKTFGANPKLRLIGVSNERVPKPTNTTFPIFYNQGSRLLNAKVGEFLLLDEAGGIRLRGSLAADLDELSKTLREK
jgi:hypothetical protein